VTMVPGRKLAQPNSNAVLKQSKKLKVVPGVMRKDYCNSPPLCNSLTLMIQLI